MRSVLRLVGIILVALAVLALVVLLGGAGMMGFAGYNTGLGMIGPGMMRGYSLLGWTIPPVFGALLIGGLGLLLLALPRGAAGRRTSSAAPVGASALDILRSRYARGEITKEEFSETRENLGR